jgi:excisionase family DNA binding protein
MEDKNRPQELVADGLLRVREAATFLSLSVASVYALMERGELPYIKIGRSRRIPRAALVELAAKNMVGGG